MKYVYRDQGATESRRVYSKTTCGVGWRMRRTLSVLGIAFGVSALTVFLIYSRSLASAVDAVNQASERCPFADQDLQQIPTKVLLECREALVERDSAVERFSKTCQKITRKNDYQCRANVVAAVKANRSQNVADSADYEDRGYCDIQKCR